MSSTTIKPFLEELKQIGLSSAKEKLSAFEYVSNKSFQFKPIFDLSYRLIKDLELSINTDIDEVEDELWNWFSYVFHKGVAVAVASRYGRDTINLIYSFDDAKQGKRPSYELTFTQEEGEYSFNLKQHFFRFDWPLQEIFYDVVDFIRDGKQEIAKQDIQFNEILMMFLSVAGYVGVDFINRIALTKEDYWSIRSSIEIMDDKLKDDTDLIEIDRLGMYDAPVMVDGENYQVCCSFCGTPALILPNSGDIWEEAILEPCEHFAFAFITDTNNHLYGRPYYQMFFKRAVIDYVETFRGFTCQNDPAAFINDFLNGDTDLDQSEMETIINILKTNLPDCNIQTKQFELMLNNHKHVFLFHFMRFIKNSEVNLVM